MSLTHCWNCWAKAVSTGNGTSRKNRQSHIIRYRPRAGATSTICNSWSPRNEKAPGSHGIPGGRRIPMLLRERLDPRQPALLAGGCRLLDSIIHLCDQPMPVCQPPCRQPTPWSAETRHVALQMQDPTTRARRPTTDGPAGRREEPLPVAMPLRFTHHRLAASVCTENRAFLPFGQERFCREIRPPQSAFGTTP
jgi:hypothetical protein